MTKLDVIALVVTCIGTYLIWIIAFIKMYKEEKEMENDN